jgi:hypothetical protein
MHDTDIMNSSSLRDADHLRESPPILPVKHRSHGQVGEARRHRCSRQLPPRPRYVSRLFPLSPSESSPRTDAEHSHSASTLPQMI